MFDRREKNVTIFKDAEQMYQTNEKLKDRKYLQSSRRNIEIILM